MKNIKFLIPLFLSTLLFGACSLNNSNNQDSYKSNANVYAFQAATSIGFIGNLNNDSNGPLKKMAIENGQDQAIIDEITQYLPTVEAALTGMDEITNAETIESDREGYQFKISITYKDIALKDNSFVMYYNETLIIDDDDDDKEDRDDDESKDRDDDKEDDGDDDEKENNKIKNVIAADDPSKKDEKDDDEFENENINENQNLEEKESEIKGIIIIQEQEYPMTGSKELDPEDNELEVSFSYQIDENSVINVEQEIENDEQSFEYEIISQGKTIYEYEIEFENDEVELEIKEGSLAKRKYSFELVTQDDKKLIKATYLEGDEEHEYLFEKVVNTETNEATYELVE